MATATHVNVNGVNVADIRIGYIVKDNRGIEYKVTRLNPKTVTANNLRDNRGWRVHYDSIVSFRKDDGSAPAAPTASVTLIPEIKTDVRLGSVVTLKSAVSAGRLKLTTSDLLVITSVNRTTFSAVKLGGTADSIYYRLGKNGLNVIDPSEITVSK